MMIYGVCLKPIMIVMELLEGGSLKEIHRESKYLPLSTKLRLGVDAAMGLGWLHNNDPMIVHRDLVCF